MTLLLRPHSLRLASPSFFRLPVAAEYSTKHKAKERELVIAHHTPRTVRPVHIERLAAPGPAHNKEISKRNTTTARFHQQQLEGQTESTNSTTVPLPSPRGHCFQKHQRTNEERKSRKAPPITIGRHERRLTAKVSLGLI